MPDENHSASASDLLFGHNASDLLRAAMDPDPERPATPPAGWQPPQPEELQAMLPQYEITAFLGRGGMGAVYRGRQLSLERPVAIKILPPGMAEIDASYAERFRHEALALAKLRHLSIVAVYDFGQTQDGMFYIAMELIKGTDVAQMMAKQGRLHSDHAMAITAHVCDALQYAHELNIIHRDIKPSNIMVGNDGSVKVTDFGLAKILHAGQPGLTRSGMALGTLQYMAPEALMLGVAVDHRADIYAVGVMLYHMLTGLLPKGLFELPSLQVPGLDPRYDAIVTRALRNDREQRYQSANALRRDLDAMITQPITQVAAPSQQAAATAPPPSKPVQPSRPLQTPSTQSRKAQAPQKPKKSSALVYTCLAGIGVGIVWLLLLAKSDPEKPHARTTEEAGAPEGATPTTASTAPSPAAPSPAAPSPAAPSPAAPAPAALVPGLTVSGQPLTVRMPFLAQGAMQLMGGYRPQKAATTAIKPASIRRAPAGISKAEYGEIKMGPASSSLSYPFIVDQADSATPRLFVDSNANGDLTDDPPATWKLETHKRQDGSEESSSSGSFRLELPREGARLNAQIHAYRFDRKAPNRPHDVLLYYSDFARTGNVTLGGKSIPAMLADDNCKGDFSDASSSFRLDLNRDGRFNLPSEIFHVKDAFNIGGTTYELSGLTPGGSSFQIVRSSKAVAESKPAPLIKVGKPAPAFEATTISGDKVSLYGSFKGRIVLLDFWASWCPPCIGELPNVMAAYEKYHGSGLEILGISLDEKEKLPAFLKEKKIPWPQVCDGRVWKDDLAQLYSVTGIPASFLIDGDTGIVLAIGLRGDTLFPGIAKALAEKKR